MKRLSIIFITFCLFASLIVLMPSGNTFAAVDDAYTVSLLHFNGLNGYQTFTDESAKTWTVHGVAYTDQTVKKFGTASGNFPGSDWITTADSTDFTLGSNNFTIDFWIKFNSVTGQSIVAGQHNSSDYSPWVIYRDGNNLDVFMSSNGTSWNVGASIIGSVTTASWYHVAIVRNGNLIIGYLNGVGTTIANTSDSLIDSNYVLSLMAHYDGVLPQSGWMDEFRFSKGIARWTSNFTPPTAEYAEPPTPTSTTNATATYQAGQTATAVAITSTAAYNLTATSSAATSTAQYNTNLTATSVAATSTAAYNLTATSSAATSTASYNQTQIAGYNNATQTAAYQQTATALDLTSTAANIQTATALDLTSTAQYNIDLTATALGFTPTFIATVTETLTPTSSATSRPAGTGMPTLQWDSTITYGDFATTTSMLCVGSLLLIAFVTWLIVSGLGIGKKS